MMTIRCSGVGVLLAAAASAALLGCSAFTSFRGPELRFAPFTPRRVDTAALATAEPVALFDFRGIVHCHSYLSHDSEGTVEEIASACRRNGVDFVVMTDHQTPESIARGVRGMVGETLFLTGAELRTRGGTLLAFPLTDYVPYSPVLPRMLKSIHDQGGLAFIGHAEGFEAWQEPGLDGVEILNLHAAIKAAPKAGTIMAALFGSVRSLFEHMVTRPDAVLAAYDSQMAGEGPLWPVVGGNDAHANVRVFGPLGGTIGNYDEVFATLTTHVLASSLSEPALVDALRAGRSYVSVDLYGDATGFDFRCVSEGRHALLGATVAQVEDQRLEVRLPAAADIRLLRDGVVVAAVPRGRRLDYDHPSPGTYRVEAYRVRERPWLLSSPIRVVRD